MAERFAQQSLSSADEQNYFLLLVSYAHAGTSAEKSAAWKALSQILATRIEQKEALEYFTFVSDLLLPKLQTMLSFDDHSWDARTLARVLRAEPAAVESALEQLVHIGMVEKIESSGTPLWKPTARLVKVSDKFGDLAMKAYHNACLDEAKEAQNLTPELRRYRSLLLPLTAEEFASLSAEVNVFLKQTLQKYQADQYQDRRLYKLNLNYFPVSEELTAVSLVEDIAE